jgi:hypothetical protein
MGQMPPPPSRHLIRLVPAHRRRAPSEVCAHSYGSYAKLSQLALRESVGLTTQPGFP